MKQQPTQQGENSPPCRSPDSPRGKGEEKETSFTSLTERENTSNSALPISKLFFKCILSFFRGAFPHLKIASHFKVQAPLLGSHPLMIFTVSSIFFSVRVLHSYCLQKGGGDLFLVVPMSTIKQRFTLPCRAVSAFTLYLHRQG